MFSLVDIDPVDNDEQGSLIRWIICAARIVLYVGPFDWGSRALLETNLYH